MWSKKFMMKINNSIEINRCCFFSMWVCTHIHHIWLYKHKNYFHYIEIFNDRSLKKYDKKNIIHEENWKGNAYLFNGKCWSKQYSKKNWKKKTYYFFHIFLKNKLEISCSSSSSLKVIWGNLFFFFQ